MNLFNISIKNVKNSFSNYIMYFISIIFSVFIFFSFKSIQYNEALSILGKSARAGINASSIVIAVFAFLFIYYSNSFFINRRKQEIGTYSILGMRKNQIGKIFIYETFFMGVGAIFIGVLLGFLFSKLMTMILIKMMGGVIIVKMSLSISALIHTLIVFTIIFIIIGIRNTLIIKNKKLIDLFKKEAEHRDNKKFLKIKGITGIILIVISYYIAAGNLIIENITLAPLILVLIVPGTFLFFSSAVFLALDKIKKNKLIYYKGRNLIAFSELSYKIQSNSRILSTIAILIATSATVLGFTVSLYYDIDRKITEDYNYSYTINANDESVNKKVDEILKKYRTTNKVIFDRKINLIQKEIGIDLIYKKNGERRDTSEYIEIIKESDFKELKEYKNSDFKKLSSNKNVYYITDSQSKMLFKSLNNTNIKIDNSIFNIQEEITKPIFNEGSTFNILVVKDDIFNSLIKKDKSRKLRLLDVENDKGSIEMSDEIEVVVNNSFEFNYPFNITSKADTYRYLLENNGLMLFIGVFLSLVFLLCTGSIILFKQLSSIYDDKDRYIMLKKLGANNKDIKKILSTQLKVVFLLPLVVGTIHNLFAMVILQKLIPRSILIPVIMTLVIYYTGYMMYYFATLKYAKDMIID